MNKLNFIFSLLITSISFAQNSQSELDVIKDFLPGDNLNATPDVAAFQKHSTLPINLYTGRVEVNLPLYTISEGNIDVPISISYNTGGIKVDDVASNVGLGWNLNAAGNVIKIVKDVEDHELDYGIYSEQDFDAASGYIDYYYPSIKGYFRTYDQIESPIAPNGYDYEPSDNSLCKDDASPDLFIANAPGLSSQFILEKTNNDYNILPIDGSGVRNRQAITRQVPSFSALGFTWNEMGWSNGRCGASASENWILNNNPFLNHYGSSYSYKSFNLTNTNGLRYTFDKTDVTETISRRLTFGECLWVTPVYKALGRMYKADVTAWHLSSIIDSETNSEVSFSYEEYSKPTLQYNKSIIEESLESDGIGGQLVFGHIPIFDEYFSDSNNQLAEFYFKSPLTYIKQPKVNRLSTINFRAGVVEFIYNHNRQDTTDEKALSEILVKDLSNNVVKKFVFDYSYFLSKEGCSEPRCKRLKLERVREIGSDNSSLDLYSFDYDYSNPLPKVHSLQKDFLGYYNNNGVSTPDYTSLTTRKPTLYYKKDLGRNSILPFPLPNHTKTIPGSYSLQPNNYSLSGLLNSVQYSTGGKSEFEYETHRFNFLGNEFTAGGARIKKQILTDKNLFKKTLDYEYLDDQGNSSGYINNLPVYGYPMRYNHNQNSNNVSFTVYDKNRTALELTDGSFVGYSQVKIKEAGNGYTIQKFNSPEHFPNQPETYENAVCDCSYPNSQKSLGINFLRTNSAFPTSNYIDNDILRGKTTDIKIFDEGNEQLRHEEFEYTRDIFQTINLPDYTDRIETYRGNVGDGPYESWLFNHSSALNIERMLNTKKTTTNYFLNSEHETVENFYYDDTYPLIKSKLLVDNNDLLHSQFYYPHNPEVYNEPLSNWLRATNRYNTPVLTKSYKNQQLLSKSIRRYMMYDNLLMLKQNDVAKGDSDYVETTIIDKRDDIGNVRQYHVKDGITTALIWSYNKNYIVAQIDNMKYFDIPASLRDNVENASNEATLITALNSLRTDNSLYNAKITTYTHKPLVGITSITDSKGYTIHYEYDQFNRLKFIKDADGNILSNNEYNFRN